MNKKAEKPTSVMDIIKFFFTQKEEAKEAFNNYHLVRRKYIVSHAAEHFNKNKLEPAPLLNLSLLDVGCGTSKLAEEMTFRGADVTAIDVSDDQLAKAKEQAQKDGAIVNFLHSTPEELVKEGKKYDIILCMDMFEYVDHPSSLIRNVRQLLNEDGIMLFSTTNRSLRSAIVHMLFAQWLFNWVDCGTYKFKRFRTPKKVIGKLEDNGFKVIDMCGAHLDIQAKRWKRCKKLGSRYLGAAVLKTDGENS